MTTFHGSVALRMALVFLAASGLASASHHRGKEAKAAAVLTVNSNASKAELESPSSFDHLLESGEALQASPLSNSAVFSPAATVAGAAGSNGYVSVYDHQGLKGNPLIWTMWIVYGGLTGLAVLFYVVWIDGPLRRKEKAKPDMGLPAGYVL
mmetsp:Transcript_45061/g.97862  ORF Transcript_45061/g.97862 Transcript_45061/m.97862 type:complete len:152 (+) Transcript_45061:123-578(+)|eukprot:CAMPEP_0170618074 /NCGR_PEP_ID=MMETSP0224-20130122/26763_1 /TAXON_ID=285029 /ORGANISM="Togula jolla, Strain CCCM 725" /LENGTH=151 /DNA_ID=CAMNT_0010944021 /DNA_START=123 /DNA_END=578 /DNA_ORIENTATION=-